jgi:hypothetical protein
MLPEMRHAEFQPLSGRHDVLNPYLTARDKLMDELKKFAHAHFQ